MAEVYERLGSWVLPREFEDIEQENTPQYDPYEDETQNKQIFPKLAEEEPTIVVANHFTKQEAI